MMARQYNITELIVLVLANLFNKIESHREKGVPRDRKTLRFEWNPALKKITICH